MNIDHQAVKEGATHWSPADNDSGRTEAYWRPDWKGGYDCWAIAPCYGGNRWQKDNYELPVYAIALPTTWNGEGLPPVGATVEIHRGKWNIRADSECFLGIPVTVVAAFKMINGPEMIAVDGGPAIGCEVFRADLARPVGTPERIAAKERSDACDAMYGVMSSVERDGNRSDMAEALYDAGYRKIANPTPE